MTDEELQDTIGKLRAFAIDLGMQWVLDEVDEAVALGVPEARTLRQTSRQGRTLYDDVTPEGPPPLKQEQSRRSRRSEEFIRSRPMTSSEQARLLLQAFGRVLADLDAVADGSIEALDPTTFSDYLEPEGVELDMKTDFAHLPVPGVESISFVPDEGSRAPAISLDVIRGSRRRARVAEIIAALEAEIDLWPTLTTSSLN
jgi:hypothetical protein